MPTRTASSKSNALPSKKTSAKESNVDQTQINGAEPIENGVNGTEDIDMVDDGPEKVKIGKDGEDEMTVVVPPPNSSKLSGEPGKDDEGDVAMENTETAEISLAEIDPKTKAIAGRSLSRSIPNPTVMRLSPICGPAYTDTPF